MWRWALTMVLLAATLLTRAWESPDSPMQNPLGWGTLRRIYFESCRPRDSGYSLGKPAWGKSGGWIERSMLLYWNSPAWDRGRGSHKRVRKPIWLKAYVSKASNFDCGYFDFWYLQRSIQSGLEIVWKGWGKELHYTTLNLWPIIGLHSLWCSTNEICVNIYTHIC